MWRPLGALLLAIVLVLARPAVSEDLIKLHPYQILLIRHAEKPAIEGDVNLAPRGQERAAALGTIFRFSLARPNPFRAPDYVFATRNTERSHRPVQTVTPFAAALGLSVNATYENEDYPRLVRELLRNPRYSGKTILVCWHQGTMPELAHSLGAKDAPDNWKKSIFDRVWQITYGSDGEIHFRDRPQYLLPGDAGH
jgi:phosphohistidine phosphatase SixA